MNSYKILNSPSSYTDLMHTKVQGGNIYAKCEWQSPFGSIKGRTAIAMIKKAIQQYPALLDKTSGYGIIEYSGGNLGIALAQICHSLDIKLDLVLPESLPEKEKTDLANLNCKIYFSPKNLGFLGTMQTAKKLAEINPDKIFLNQHKNRENIKIHQKNTAQEIIEQLSDYKITPCERKICFVTSIGTGASLIGTYSGLKQYYPNIKLFATMPAEMPYATKSAPKSGQQFSGSGGLGYGIRQPFVKPHEDFIKDYLLYDIDTCLNEMKRFYNNTGFILGSSSAANHLGAQKLITYGYKHVITLYPSLANSKEAVEVKLKYL